MKRGGLRHLNSTCEFFKIFWGTSRTMMSTRHINASDRPSPALLEKVMLAVSGVNRCEYCSYRHSRTALEAGVDAKDIKDLLAGDIENLPEEEAIAVSYAQHWTESRGGVSAKARRRVVREYGEDSTRFIEAHIRSVYFGNMVSNTVYVYKNDMVNGRKKRKLLFTYLLCYPIASMIRKGMPVEK